MGALTLALTLLLVLTPTSVESSYRRFFDVELSGSAIILEFSVVFIRIDDYGVVSIYMTPGGAFAYGYTVLKKPGEVKPRIYIHAGLQNETFSGGFLVSTSMKARVVVLTKLNKTIATYRVDSTSTKLVYETKILFHKINRVVVASINVTGRGAEAPSLRIRYVKVISLMDVSDWDLHRLSNIDEDADGYSKTLIRDEYVGAVTGSGVSLTTVVLLTIPPITASVAFITLWRRRWRRTQPGSH